MIEKEWRHIHTNGSIRHCESEQDARNVAQGYGWKGRIEWRTAWRDYSSEPILPVSAYCDAMFVDWPRSIRELLASPECRDYDRQIWEPVLAGFAAIYPLPILKSNYLARRIYGGEEHRTEKCPVHKGRWSGCYPADEPDGSCACVTGGNTTGWLPPRASALSADRATSPKTESSVSGGG